MPDTLYELVDKLKTCPETDIPFYLDSFTPLFLVLPKAEMSKVVSDFHTWADENVSKDSLKFFYAEYFIGIYLMLNEEFEKALPLITKARKSFGDHGHIDGEEMCSLLTGVIYRSLGNFDLALKTLIKPFEFFKNTPLYRILFEGSCNSLAHVNFELRNYDEAFSIFKTGYEASLQSGNYYFRIYALDGMGKIKMLQHKPEEAKEYFHKALDEAQKTKSPLHISNALNELAVFDAGNGNFAEAEKLNKEALTIREKENLTGAVITSYINLGEVFLKQSKWEDALEVLNKALGLAEQVKVKPKMYQVHLLLSKVYKGMGDTKQSLYHYEIFHELREKVLEEDNARKLIDAKLIFESEQTKKENIIIKKQKQEIESKNLQVQETIDELTITKVSRKAKVFTLFIGIALIIAEEPIFAVVLKQVGENLFLNITAKVIIILSLKPIDQAIERYLLKRVILKKRKHGQRKGVVNAMDTEIVEDTNIDLSTGLPVMQNNNPAIDEVPPVKKQQHEKQ